MNFYDVINKRRSIRQFQNKKIDEVILKRIIAAGLKAPSSNHQRKWKFVILNDKTRLNQLTKIVKPYKFTFKNARTPAQKMFNFAYPLQQKMVSESQAVTLPFYYSRYTKQNDPKGYGLQDYAAVWTAIENMLLAATYEGLGTAIHIPVGQEPTKIKQLLKVPNNWHLPSLVVLGYSISNPTLPEQVETNLHKNCSWNNW